MRSGSICLTSIRMVHEDAFEDSTLFAKLLTHYVLSQPMAKAVRHRTKYLFKKLYDVVTQSPKPVVEVLCVGAGPALEFKLLFDYHPDVTNRIALTLLDQEKQALQFSQAHLRENCSKYQSTMNVTLLQQTLEDYLREYGTQDRQNTYDFIYASGLFDYFTEKVSKLMIKCLLSLINPGGRLLITNASPGEQHYRHVMEFSLDWYLIYRDSEDLRRLTAGIPRAQNFSIDQVDNGMFTFLEIWC